MTAWDVTVNNVQLNTGGSGVSDITGMGGIAGRAFYNQSAYAHDGESSVIGGLASGVFGLTVWVDDHDRLFSVQPESLVDRQGVAMDNFTWLVGLFASDYLLTVAVALPGSPTLNEAQRTRLCRAQLVTMSAPRWNASRTYAEVTLGFKIPDVYWRAWPTAPLDAEGYYLAGFAGGNPGGYVSVDTYKMNGFIEDGIIFVQNGPNPLSGVLIRAAYADAAILPEINISTPRAGGLLSAGALLTIDCKKHLAYTQSSGGVTENVFKFANWQGGRPGSMLRVGPPYLLFAGFTPVTPGASINDVSWLFKYRPSFI